jgi:uncharacterized membrane protein YfcA
MSPTDILLVGSGAFVAGAMNAMAGGGSFFSFPALLAAGVPPIMANASNTVALWPASLASAWAYRHEALRHRRWALLLAGLSMLGGLLGGLLLLAISNQTFMGLVPWLLLVATSLFAFSAQISRLIQTLRTKLSLSARASPGSAGGAVFQLGVAIYGGFFGAGMGILTLAALSIQGFEDLQEINALKNLTSAMNYTVAAATFILAGAISWPHTLLALVTAAVGSVVGSALARRMSNRWLKRLVILVGASLSLIYFIKTA